MTLLLALIGAAIGVGSLHTLAPDHWVPFAALARAERWSAGRTAFVTAACGLGHVSVSVAMGLAALWLGIEVLARVGHRLESVSGLLLIGFGLAYAAWGFHERAAGLPHGHAHHAHPHGHSRHGARPARMTAWTLFVLFSADPCVAVIPLIFASAPLGWAGSLTVVAAYEAATIATMVVLVLPARAAARAIRSAWVDRWGDALAGAVVAAVGLLVAGLGI